MRFYTKQHPFYCGIDLHARTMYLCIIDQQGNTVLHANLPTRTDALYNAIAPYKGNIVIGVECMFCWYWVSDFCEDFGIPFVLGHALYMGAIHGGKAKNDKIDSYKIARLIRGGNFPLAYHYPKQARATRDLLRRRQHLVQRCAELKAHVKNTRSQYNLPPLNLDLHYAKARLAMRNQLDDADAQRSIDLDLDLIDFYQRKLDTVTRQIERQAKAFNPTDYTLLRSVTGIGQVLALTILYEIGDIDRFPTVQKFASYSRLVKCKAESAGKSYGSQGSKIGNRHLKWAFSEACVLILRDNPDAKRYIERLQKRMSKAKALTALAHKLGRAVYFMLKRKQVFDHSKFFSH